MGIVARSTAGAQGEFLGACAAICQEAPTPARPACGMTQPETADCDTNPGPARLVAAAEAGELETVRALLDAGADPNALDAEQRGALSEAALEGHEVVARLLLERGANPNLADPYEFKTPLMAAADAGHASIVCLLVAHGARVDDADDYGETALCRAASRGHVAVVRALLDAGADPRKEGELGTPCAVAAGRWPEVLALLHAALQRAGP